MFRALVETHERLGALADDLESLLRADQPPAASILGSKRMWLSATVRDYLMLEDKLLITPLRNLRTAEADDIVSHFTTGLSKLRMGYSQHVADWPSTRVTEAWNQYRRATRLLLRDLREMISHKNTVLLPRAEKALAPKTYGFLNCADRHEIVG